VLPPLPLPEPTGTGPGPGPETRALDIGHAP